MDVYTYSLKHKDFLFVSPNKKKVQLIIYLIKYITITYKLTDMIVKYNSSEAT